MISPHLFSWGDISVVDSSDANVRKLVSKNTDAVAEAVLYKYPTYEDRTVICCSTQSGCPVGCRFCGAGDYFVRSLTSTEIVDQVKYCISLSGVAPENMKKLQIMFMSMGEPMLNFSQLEIAIRELYSLYPHARLLISTSAPRNFPAFEKLRALSVEVPTVGLQFSVHESTDENRKKLIPSATMTLAEIAAEGYMWWRKTGRKPFFNYCVHDKNNTADDVQNLLLYFSPEIFEATLSVICERDEHIAAANERQRKLAEDFSSLMVGAGYGVRVFNPAGQDDIGGGCGQLWFVQSWMKNHPEHVKQSRGHGLPVVHTPKAHE